MSERRREDTASWDAERVRRTQSEHRPQRPVRRRRKRVTFLNVILYLIFVVLASALLAGFGWLLASDLCAFNQGARVTATVEVTAEDTVDTVAEKLHDAGLIEYQWFFKLFSKFAHAEDKIGIGVYELNTDMDYRALIVNMHNASGNMNAETVKVTIPEGYTVAQTLHLLAEKGVNTEEKLMEAAQKTKFDYEFINNNSQELSRLEGYLFPDTYEFYLNEKPDSAIRRLLSNFERKMENYEDQMAEAEARGYDRKKIIIIASLIEKETDGTDQRKIASVIYNRLENAGETANLLQIDASLLYALPEHTGPITNEDKAVKSPYNLYTNKGLPPTAIANPGLKAISAALNPETTNYYFYALGKDGVHHYAETYNEHVAFLNSGNYGG